MPIGDGYITQQPNTGSFVSNTSILDVTRLHDVDVKSPEFKELLVRLYQDINNMALSLNTKTSGQNLLEEFVTGDNFFNPVSNSTGVNTQLDLRPKFRIVVDIGALGPGVTTVAHNLAITNTWKFVKVEGCASDTVGFNYYQLPWASAGGATNIELKANLTSVVITNNSGISFNNCMVILEYLKL